VNASRDVRAQVSGMSASLLFAPVGPNPDALAASGGEMSAVPAAPLSNATLRLWKAFSPMAPEPRRSALAIGAVDPAVAGTIDRFGDTLAVVVSGCFAVKADGSDVVTEILRPGDFLATGAAGETLGCWITDGEVYRASLNAWLDLGGTAGFVHMMTAVENRRGALSRRLLCAIEHRATARVADLLLAIHEAAPGQPILLSQERLGGMLGLRRTTVNASCQILETVGGSRNSRGKMRVTDALALAAAACGCRLP